MNQKSFFLIFSLFEHKIGEKAKKKSRESKLCHTVNKFITHAIVDFFGIELKCVQREIYKFSDFNHSFLFLPHWVCVWCHGFVRSWDLLKLHQTRIINVKLVSIPNAHNNHTLRNTRSLLCVNIVYGKNAGFDVRCY